MKFILSLISTIFVFTASWANADLDIISIEEIKKELNADIDGENNNSKSSNNSKLKNQPSLKYLKNQKQKSNILIEEALNTLTLFKDDISASNSIRSARAILIIPNKLDGFLIFGGGGATALFLARNEKGKWSYPSFYDNVSVSIGLQLGFTNSNNIITFNSKQAVAGFLNENIIFDLGIGGTAFSSGKKIAAGTNRAGSTTLHSKSKGLHIGADLNFKNFKPNNLLNALFYGKKEANSKTISIEGRYKNDKANPIRDYLNQFKHIYN